ncbi:CotH kinase family protein [bacterium]|nr:CotH kinase family protein [bacterium]
MKSSKAFNAAVAVALLAAVALTVCLMAFPQLLGGESSAIAETYEEKLFGTGGVLSVDISVKESDWENMLANATAEEYIPCDVTVDGYTVSVAGIRCKGNSSLSSVFSSDSERYSFKVEFDHYAAGRSLYGLDKLALNDCYADASYMKEYLSYEMFRSLGVATPLCAFANITVNGEPWGLYLAVECIEESFALRNYGAENINLYKPESDDMGRGGNFGGGKGAFGLGDAQNQPDAGTVLPEEMQLPEGMEMPEGMGPSGGMNFPAGAEPPDGAAGRTGRGQAPGGVGAMPGGADAPEQNAAGFPNGMSGTGGGSDLAYTDDDLDSYSDIFDAQVLGQESNAAHRRVVSALKNLSEGNLEEAIDVDEVARYFAVNTVLVNLDHYTGSLKHNYYLMEENGLLSMLPWDYNMAFAGFSSNDAQSAVNFPIDTPVSGTTLAERPIIGQLLSDEEGLALYHDYLAQVVEKWFDSGLLLETIDGVTEMIAPYVREDATAFYTYDEFTAAVDMLKVFVTLRGESLRGQLDGTIPTTQEGQAAEPDALIDAGSLDLSRMSSMGGGFGAGGKGGGMHGFDRTQTP